MSANAFIISEQKELVNGLKGKSISRMWIEFASEKKIDQHTFNSALGAFNFQLNDKNILQITWFYRTNCIFIQKFKPLNIDDYPEGYHLHEIDLFDPVLGVPAIAEQIINKKIICIDVLRFHASPEYFEEIHKISAPLAANSRFNRETGLQLTFENGFKVIIGLEIYKNHNGFLNIFTPSEIHPVLERFITKERLAG